MIIACPNCGEPTVRMLCHRCANPQGSTKRDGPKPPVFGPEVPKKLDASRDYQADQAGLGSLGFSRAELEDFRRGVDEDDTAAWGRFKAAVERVTGVPQPPKPLPAGWTVIGEPGW